LCRRLIQRGAAAIPKSVQQEQIAENRNVFAFGLSGDDMEMIATRMPNESSFFPIAICTS